MDGVEASAQSVTAMKLCPSCVIVSVCVRTDRTRLTFTAHTHTHTHAYTYSDDRLRDDECGSHGSPHLQGCGVHRDPVSSFLTRGKWRRAGRVDRGGHCRWWKDPGDQQSGCWEFCLRGVRTGRCKSTELLPPFPDRCFIVPTINQHLFCISLLSREDWLFSVLHLKK